MRIFRCAPTHNRTEEKEVIQVGIIPKKTKVKGRECQDVVITLNSNLTREEFAKKIKEIAEKVKDSDDGAAMLVVHKSPTTEIQEKEESLFKGLPNEPSLNIYSFGDCQLHSINKTGNTCSFHEVPTQELDINTRTDINNFVKTYLESDKNQNKSFLCKSEFNSGKYNVICHKQQLTDGRLKITLIFKLPDEDKYYQVTKIFTDTNKYTNPNERFSSILTSTRYYPGLEIDKERTAVKKDKSIKESEMKTCYYEEESTGTYIQSSNKTSTSVEEGLNKIAERIFDDFREHIIFNAKVKFKSYDHPAFLGSKGLGYDLCDDKPFKRDLKLGDEFAIVLSSDGIRKDIPSYSNCFRSLPKVLDQTTAQRLKNHILKYPTQNNSIIKNDDKAAIIVNPGSLPDGSVMVIIDAHGLPGEGQKPIQEKIYEEFKSLDPSAQIYRANDLSPNNQKSK